MKIYYEDQISVFIIFIEYLYPFLLVFYFFFYKINSFHTSNIAH